MKICLITHYLPSYRTAFLRFLGDSPNIELSVYADHENDFFKNFHFIKNEDFSFEYSRVRVLKLYNQRFFWQFKIIKLIILSEYDIFILTATKSDFSVWMGLFLARILGKKVILWGHFKNNTITERISNMIFLRLSHSNVFYSINELSKYSPSIKTKSFVANNTMAVVTDLPNSRPKGNTIIFTGRLLKGKKLDVLLEALSIVKLQYKFNLILVGDGPEKDNLNSLVRELNLVDYVDFKGAIFDEEILQSLYSDSLLSVIPSHAGLAIHHAFGNSRIVITDNDLSEQPPEYYMIKDGINGFIYDSFNHLMLADLIIYCFENRHVILEMGETAKYQFKTDYGIEKMVDGFMSAIKYN